MKIDTEGTEVEILKGSTESLKNMLGIVIITNLQILIQQITILFIIILTSTDAIY